MPSVQASWTMIIIGAHPIAMCSHSKSQFIFIFGHIRLSLAIGVSWGDDSLHSEFFIHPLHNDYLT